MKVFDMSPADVDTFLSDLRGREADFGARVVAVAERSLDTPYANGPLGEGPTGKYDTDPLIDLTKVDCVTFLEQTFALAMAKDYQEAFDTLQRIRYRDGVIDFETRNHFMIADWVANNRFCQDVSAELGVATDSVTRTISKRAYFPKVNAPELGQDTPDRDITLQYVPVDKATAAVAKMPTPALVVFIGKVDWLFALHCGLFVRDSCGAGLLYHASSKAGKVVRVDFAAYVEEQSSRYLGFTAYALSDAPETPKE